MILSDKVHNKLDEYNWKASQETYSILSVPSKDVLAQDASGKKILVLRDVFKIEYTGVKKTVGSPNSYEKNLNEG